MQGKGMNIMKKFILAIVSVVMLGGVIPTGHIHDEHCGYDPETNSGCVYEVELFQDEELGD